MLAYPLLFVRKFLHFENSNLELILSREGFRSNFRKKILMPVGFTSVRVQNSLSLLC